MFSRDSQFSRNSESTRDRPFKQRSRDSLREVDLVNQNGKTENGVVKTMPTTEVERTQSWRVAPDLFASFKYAWAGITYAFTTQRNFRIHTVVGSIAITLCWLLHVSTVETAVICLTIGAVLVMEILNTALESLVDLTVGQTYHELAKIAKDCAAGAVLMAAMVALTIAILIFAPPLWDNLRNYIV